MRLLAKQEVEQKQSTGKIDEMNRVMALRSLLHDEELKLKSKLAEIADEQRKIAAAHADFTADYARRIAPLRGEIETLEARRRLALEPIKGLEETANKTASEAEELNALASSLLALVEKRQSELEREEQRVSERLLWTVSKEKELKAFELALQKREKTVLSDEQSVTTLRTTLEDGTDKLRTSLHTKSEELREKIYNIRDDFNRKADEREKELRSRAELLDSREKELELKIADVSKREAELWALRDILDDQQQSIDTERIRLQSQEQALRTAMHELDNKKSNGK